MTSLVADMPINTARRSPARNRNLSEQRARAVTRDLLRFRGWDIRPVTSSGQLLEENEYRGFATLAAVFGGKSKTGPGDGRPDFLLVDSAAGLVPQIVIDTKAGVDQLKESQRDTTHYGDACREAGHDVLAVAVAGADHEICEVRVQRRVNKEWRDLTLHGAPIDWIPSPQQTAAILSVRGRTEVSPERPSDEVLAEQANRLNEILRECNIKDEYRPVYAATFMLALYYSKIDADKNVVLEQVNGSAKRALQKAGKSDLSYSLRVDAENNELASRAWEIIDILKKLNIRSFLHEHDYLGQLYETFFRYTGGNTIGQYFTPRHIIEFMCELVGITAKDTVFDPACGTGGFLIGALNRMIRLKGTPYQEAMDSVKANVFGMEIEPATAALCVTNMILRGDGTSGIVHKGCFDDEKFPGKEVDCALLNPPFPIRRKTTGNSPTRFIDRALKSVRHKGLVASIVPYSLLVKTQAWHRTILKHHRLLMVASLPKDLFSPYANFNTALILLQKGTPHGSNKVFLARVHNDGFKLKKNTRVAREGGQLDQLLTAFEAKTVVPEFTAYDTITTTSSEWAPEAYITGAPHRDADFVLGLEQSIRDQAAFYIQTGHRILGAGLAGGLSSAANVFSSESKVDLSGIEMQPFCVGDHFNIRMGGRQEVEDLSDDPPLLPIVTASEVRNGVTTWKNPEVIYLRRRSRCPRTASPEPVSCKSFHSMPFTRSRYSGRRTTRLRPTRSIIFPTY